MSKSGKLRSLIRELRTSYVGDDSAMTTLFFHKIIGVTLEMSCKKRQYAIASHHTKSQPANIHPSRLRNIPALEACIREIDAAYDSCNEAMARGEADKFRSEQFPVPTYIFVCNIFFLYMIQSLYISSNDSEKNGHYLRNRMVYIPPWQLACKA